MNSLFALEEQINHVLENLKKRQQTVKKYFDKKAKSVIFRVDEKVFLWNSAHANKGKHSNIISFGQVYTKLSLS
jgi:hypothetical protein